MADPRSSADAARRKENAREAETDDFSGQIDPSVGSSSAVGIAGLAAFVASEAEGGSEQASSIATDPSDEPSAGLAPLAGEQASTPLDAPEAQAYAPGNIGQSGETRSREGREASEPTGFSPQNAEGLVDVAAGARASSALNESTRPENVETQAPVASGAPAGAGDSDGGEPNPEPTGTLFDTWQPDGPFVAEIAESLATGSVVLELADVDQYGEPIEYTLTDATGNPLVDTPFVIDGNVVRVAEDAALDYEAGDLETLFVTATNSGGVSGPWTLTLTITDVSEDVFLGDGGEAFVDSGVAERSVIGGDGDDWISGHNDGAMLRGGGGDDFVVGGEGSDALSGGDGDDRLSGGTGGSDTFFGDSGADTLDGSGSDRAGVDYSGSSSGVDVDLTSGTGGGAGSAAEGDVLIGIDDVVGSSFDDTLTGDASDNVLSSGDGADVIAGGAGNDRIDGAGGADTAVFSGTWADYLITENEGVYTVTDTRPGSPDGTDTVTSVEVFRFADGDVAVADVLNTGPTGIDATGGSVSEDSAAGTVVATLTVVDANAADVHTFEIVSDPSGHFEVVGNTLRISDGASLDYETADTHQIVVRVTDANGESTTETLTVSITDTAETIVLSDGGGVFVDTGVAETSVRGQGDGADTIVGGDGDNTFDGGRGDDFLSGGDGDDRLEGSDGADTLLGGAGSDAMSGGSGDDVIKGGDGHDEVTLQGAVEDYAVTYDTATDTFVISDLNAADGLDEGQDTITGVEMFTFGDGTLTKDELVAVAEEQANVAPGEVGLADGGEVAENSAGGTVVATLTATDADGDSLTFQITDAAGAPIEHADFEIVGDGIRVKDGASLDFEANDTVELYVVASDGLATGQPQLISVTISDVAEEIQLGDGSETYTETGVTETSVRGGSGDDLLVGGTGDDSLVGDSGSDTITGGDGDDVLSGENGDDIVAGGLGDDTVSGGGGEDILDGGDGDDSLEGGSGDDVIRGGEGTDTARFEGSLSDFAVTFDPDSDSFVLTDLNTADGASLGADTVSGVEVFDFGGDRYTRDDLILEAERQANSGPSMPSADVDGPVEENSAAGTVVATLTATDADGEALVYRITDSDGNPIRHSDFEVVGNEIRVKDGASLDYESLQDITLHVTASDRFETSAPTEVSLTVGDAAEDIHLGDGADSFTEAGVTETSVDGGAGNDTLFGGDGGDNLRGGDDHDRLVGRDGDDRLSGDGGNDWLDAGLGGDTMQGGAGNDFLDGGVGVNGPKAIIRLDFGDSDASAAEATAGSDVDGIYRGDAAPNTPGWNGEDSAVSLDGSGDYVEIPDQAKFDLASGTVSIRFNADDISGTQTLVSRDSSQFDGGGHFRLILNDDGGIELRMQDEDTSYTLRTDDGVFDAGEWNHVAVTFGPGGVQLYVNGALVETDPYTGGIAGNDEPWTLGADQWRSSDGEADNLEHYFDGSLDEFALIDTQLDAEAIATLATDGVGALDAPDVAVYEGDFADFDIQYHAQWDIFVITDRNADDGDEGRDVVRSVEEFVFNGVTYTSADLQAEAARQANSAPEEPTATVRGPVAEDSAEGRVVATLHATDAEADDITYVLTDADGTPITHDSFEIVGNTIRVKDGAALDFESSDTETVFVTATDGQATSTPREVTISVFDVAEEIALGDGGVTYTEIGVTETSVTGGDGADSLVGGDGNDVFIGGDGADTLEGGAGQDSLAGGAGDDSLVGGEGNDSLDGGTGTDTLDGGDGADTFFVGDGGFGATVIGGEGGDDRDTFDLTGSSAGVRMAFSGDGSGRYAENGSRVVGEFTEIETLQLSDNNDVVDARRDTTGISVDMGAGNDMVAGGSGSDTLTGGGGNDWIYASDGDDRMIGGEGNDTIYGGTNGTDTAVYRGAIEGFEISYDRDTEAFTIRDTNTLDRFDEGTDVVTGVEKFEFGGVVYDAADMAEKFAPPVEEAPEEMDDNPDYDSGGRDATFSGGQGSGRYYAGSRDDVIYAKGGNDEIGGGAGDDRMYGGSGNDRVYGQGGDDTLYGGSGNDSINGHDGDDLAFGDGGNDRMHGEDGNDTMRGGTGNDSLYGGDDNDNLFGDDGNDEIHGEDGDDTLTGGLGNDSLVAGSGDDLLNGGVGNDSMYGGDGNDTFVISASEGNDEIDGGMGGNWVDVITLEDLGPATDISGNTVTGDGWTMVLEDGHSVTGKSLDSLELSPDAIGVITFDDGGVIDFTGIERIEY